jgi:DNA-binding transcriptional MerR regulator
MRSFGIGELANRTGCKVETIRYYEGIKLLQPPSRSTGGQRRYSEVDATRLSFIRHARALGFDIDSVRQLLALSAQPEQSCATVDTIARRHMRDIDDKIRQLTALRREMQRMTRQCKGGRISDCRILETLSTS